MFALKETTHEERTKALYKGSSPDVLKSLIDRSPLPKNVLLTVTTTANPVDHGPTPA